jgi:phosphoribosylformylglycinamidine synthase subunit PurL
MTPPAEEPLPDVPLHRALGLTDDEFDAVGKILGRSPNHLELALYAVMWSEH